MITKVVHGWKVGGLIVYLMGPGRAQEHVQPRVIASWDGRDAGWQPAATGPGEHERDLGPLIRALRAPAVAAGLPEQKVDDKRGYVWHLSARVSAADRVLTDAEWAGIARELLHGAGVAVRGDAGGPRWVAIRHADDHIHVAVVLVRQEDCRRFWPSRDYPRLRETARGIERRMDLSPTAAADGTAARAPVRGEIEKTRRSGREPARVELARAVRAAAVASDGVVSFVAELERAGYLVQLRRAPSGGLLGYKIARPGEVWSTGKPVFFSGSKLAPDLSLPRLAAAWADATGVDGHGSPVQAARHQVVRARASVGAARRGRGEEDVGEIAHATRDVLTAMAGWSSELGAAAEVFDRAARPPRGLGGAAGSSAAGLRGAARALIRSRRVLGPGEDPDAAMVALAVAVAALLREIAAWQREKDRGHQAAAARRSARHVQGWAAPYRPLPPRPAVAKQQVDHAPAAQQPQGDRAGR